MPLVCLKAMIKETSSKVFRFLYFWLQLLLAFKMIDFCSNSKWWRASGSRSDTTELNLSTTEQNWGLQLNPVLHYSSSTTTAADRHCGWRHSAPRVSSGLCIWATKLNSQPQHHRPLHPVYARLAIPSWDSQKPA